MTTDDTTTPAADGRGSTITYFQRCPYGGGTDPACRNCGRALSSHAQTPDGYECRALRPAAAGAPGASTNGDGIAFASTHLQAQGLTILARRVGTRWGEIELVGHDEQRLIFCTVRTRRVGTQDARVPLGAEHSRRMRRMAAAWLAESSAPRMPELRFDAIGVTLDDDGRVVALEHLAGAY